MPRILIVHNRYRSEYPSGENNVVDQQVDLLRGAGVEVETYIRSSDEITDFSLAERIELGVRPIHSREDVAAFDALLARFRPDVVHIHNVYPLISPAVIGRAQARGCRVVQTVHNFRHVCASASFFRDGKICMDCVGKRVPWPAMLHGCYRGSRPQSVLMGTAIARHRKTWLGIDRFLPVSRFVADMLATTGIPAEQMYVVPNAIPDPGPPTPAGEGYLFAGRLSDEKGIALLLDAWERSGLGKETELTVVGDGPDRAAVERAAARIAGVHYEGPQTGDEVRARMRACRAVVVPSMWFEALPTVLLEAYACGRPVVATKIGALETLVTRDVGWLAAPDVAGVAATLRASGDDPDAAAMGRRARDLYETQYAPGAVLAELLGVYRDLAPAPGGPAPADSSTK